MSAARGTETALVVTVPEAEPLVRDWRLRLDPAAAAGVPAHVTVLAPFLNFERIDDDVVRALEALIGRFPAFEARFDGFGRFPAVLYLAPAPDQPFRELTEAIAARWPDAPPYGGQYADVIPHLTIALADQQCVLDEAAAAIAGQLPVVSRVMSVRLLVNVGGRWEQRAEFPLLG
jgi:2'-5' RNA ligase